MNKILTLVLAAFAFGCLVPSAQAIGVAHKSHHKHGHHHHHRK